MPVGLTSMTSKQQTIRPAGISELKEAIGSMFFVWARVESALQEAITALEPQEKGAKTQGISRSIKRFRSLHLGAAEGRDTHIDLVNLVVEILSDALEDRNLIAHGLCGWHRSRVDNPAETRIMAELDNCKKVISLEELLTNTERLNSIASQMDRITYAALHPEEVGIRNIYSDISRQLRDH